MGIGKKNSKTNEKLQRYQSGMVLFFSLTILVVVVFVTFVVLKNSEVAMRNNASKFIAINSEQIEINIDTYFNQMEETAALLFADDEYYLYDETNAFLDDYTRIKSEEAIMDRIVDIGLMYNYSDFFICYSDDNTVGWKSKVTQALFTDVAMYQVFSGRLDAAGQDEAWCFGINDNLDRIFYVKKLNPNAILVTSVYSKELESVFKHPDSLEELTIRLVDENNQVIFAVNRSEIGNKLPDDIAFMIEDKSNISVINGEYLVNVSTCENGWRVVSAVPTATILGENESLRYGVVFFVIVLTCVIVLFNILMISLASRNVNVYVDNLHDRAVYDDLSGLFNKKSFRELVKAKMKNRNENMAGVAIMFDMDNFKKINDLGGHSYGDRVIARIGNLLKQTIGVKGYVGRVGGDEFAAYMEIKNTDPENVRLMVEEELKVLIDEYGEEFKAEAEKFDTSVSIGAHIVLCEEEDYETVYKNADTALYQSKRNGKKQFTIYEEGMSFEE